MRITPHKFVRGLIVGETIEVPYYGEMHITGIFIDPHHKQKATIRTIAYDENDERNILLWSSEARRNGEYETDHPLEVLMPGATDYINDYINCGRCGGHGSLTERDLGQQSGNGYEPTRCPNCLGSGVLPPNEDKTTPQY